MATYGEAVAESGALGGVALDRSCQAAGQAHAHLGLDGADGLLGAKALVKAHREPARCHGHDVRRRGRNGRMGVVLLAVLRGHPARFLDDVPAAGES